MQAIAILFGAGFTIAACVALGSLILGAAERHWGARFVTGAAALSLVVFTICALGVAYPAVLALVGTGVLILWWRREGRPVAAGKVSVNSASLPGASRAALYALLLAFSAYFLLYFFNAMAPEASPDGSQYHLGLVGRYLREHGFHRITDNMYANLSQGLEMVFLFAFAFGKHSAASMVHFAFLIALVWQMISYGRRSGFPWAGAAGALLVFASPVVGIDATSAYNDVAVAAIAFTLFYLLRTWETDRSPRLLVAIGLVAGFGYAVKYTAWVAVPYAIGFVLWKSGWRGKGRGLKYAAIVGGSAALLFAPWMAKNWLWLANPFSPLLNQWFPNPYITVAFEREYRDYLAIYDLSSRWAIPLEVTTLGSLSGLLGPVFLLAPVALLALRKREGRHLFLAALIFGAHYFSNIGTRFLIPSLPFLALAMALSLSSVRGLAVAVALMHAVISWPSIVPKYSRPETWRISKMPWREALRIKPEEEYLEKNAFFYGAARLLDRVTPPGSSVLTATGIPEAYTSRRVLVAYQSAENKIRGDLFWTGFVPEWAPVWRLKFAFSRQALTAVRVVQTNTGRDLWRIHEFRIRDGARELPRRPAWRLRARPYPWGIQDAFDNSLATFWLNGDHLRPGQSVEVEFGAAEQADSVIIESSPNQFGIRLRLEGRDTSGRWIRLAGKPQASSTAKPLGLRRAVAGEMKRRGVDYLLAFDGEFGSDDLRRNADMWGIREVGEYKGARVYQLP